jgi:flagellar hook-basal body complex protein FliE
MITAEKANISLQLTVAIRNKILDAYNEIMRMQV